MAEIKTVLTVAGGVMSFAFLLRIGWALGGAFMRWIGTPDPSLTLTINDHWHSETGIDTEEEDDA